MEAAQGPRNQTHLRFSQPDYPSFSLLKPCLLFKAPRRSLQVPFQPHLLCLLGYWQYSELNSSPCVLLLGSLIQAPPSAWNTLLSLLVLSDSASCSKLHVIIAFFPGGSDGKESACNAGDLGLIPGLGRSLKKGMATHSSILAWRIPWTEEPSGLQFTGSQRLYMIEQLTLSLPYPRLSPSLIWPLT